MFCSKNAFLKQTLSRRDDIISLVYLLIYLVDSKLPWINREVPEAGMYRYISKFKRERQLQEFLTDKSKMMQPLLQIANLLEFDEKPDYRKMKFLLQKIQLDRDYLPDR
jgi:hypothetical protein